MTFPSKSIIFWERDPKICAIILESAAWYCTTVLKWSLLGGREMKFRTFFPLHMTYPKGQAIRLMKFICASLQSKFQI